MGGCGLDGVGVEQPWLIWLPYLAGGVMANTFRISDNGATMGIFARFKYGSWSDYNCSFRSSLVGENVCGVMYEEIFLGGCELFWIVVV